MFDVGANVGEWSKLAHKAFPRAAIHTFELSAATFSNLTRNLGDACFRHNNVALAAEEGTLTYADRGANSGHNSIIPGVAPKTVAATTAAKMTTGDAYCAENGIEAIDFLKIDVEGAEHLVLQGFSRMLAEGRIRCIQFEYGYANGDAKFLMRDFYALLESYGYTVGKIWSNGVSFGPFEYPLNDFRSGPNFCAIHSKHKSLVERLRVGHHYGWRAVLAAVTVILNGAELGDFIELTWMTSSMVG